MKMTDEDYARDEVMAIPTSNGLRNLARALQIDGWRDSAQTCRENADEMDRLTARAEEHAELEVEAKRLSRVSFARISELEQQVEMLRSMIHKGLEDRDRLAARLAESTQILRRCKATCSPARVDDINEFLKAVR